MLGGKGGFVGAQVEDNDEGKFFKILLIKNKYHLDVFQLVHLLQLQ